MWTIFPAFTLNQLVLATCVRAIEIDIHPFLLLVVVVFGRRLVDVLHLCAMLLSQNQCTRLLSMPGLVEIAAESLTGSMGVSEGGVRSCHLTRSRASR